MATGESLDNYYRLITLIVKTGTKTLLEIFKLHVDLSTVFASYRSKFDELRLRKILTEPQYHLLTTTSVDLTKFDISLLVILIRNVCSGVDAPVKGWNEYDVEDSDKTVGGCIYRIRAARNLILHKADTEECQVSFELQWGAVKSSLLEIARRVGNAFVDEIDTEISRIEGIRIVADEGREFEEALKKWDKVDMYGRLAQLEEKSKQTDKTEEEVAELEKEVASVLKRRDIKSDREADVNITTLIYNKMQMLMTKNVNIFYINGSPASPQQTETLPPITNLNALTEDEIKEYAREIDERTHQKIAIHLAFSDQQVKDMKSSYPGQIEKMIVTMLQKWHDVVARCEEEDPKLLLAAAFARVQNNRMAKILGNGQDLKRLVHEKPKEETAKKIKAISFDREVPQYCIVVPSSTTTNRVGNRELMDIVGAQAQGAIGWEQQDMDTN